MARVTKTSITIGVMNENADKPMATVVALIVAAQHAAGNINVTEKIAAGAYRWCVNKGVATGLIPVKTKTVRAPKEKVVKVKTKKEAVAKIKAEKPVETKSPEEIARIKAANLARIKEVAKKFNKQKEQEEVYTEKDPFAAPDFLTREEVKALV